MLLMKKLVIGTALALAALAASPTLAKTHHSGSSAGPAVDPYTVIVNGEVVGRDPDPNIRFQLMRDTGLPAD
jgi:hypothetical protein